MRGKLNTAVGDVVAGRFRIEQLQEKYLSVVDTVTNKKKSLSSIPAAPFVEYEFDEDFMGAIDDLVSDGDARYIVIDPPIDGICLRKLITSNARLEIEDVLAIVDGILEILEERNATHVPQSIPCPDVIFVRRLENGFSVQLPPLSTTAAEISPYLSSFDTSAASTIPKRQLYAVGVMLYEMITGHRPKSPFDLMEEVASSPPREIDPEIWLALFGVIQKAVAKDPPSIAAMRNELSRVEITIHTASGHSGDATVEATAESQSAIPKHDKLPQLDDNVQFTVYRPSEVRPEVAYPLLAFAHLSENPPEAPDDELHPLEKVAQQAEAYLGKRFDEFKNLTQDADAAIPKGGVLTFLPEIDGVSFTPPRRTFEWGEENVHLETFLLKASKAIDRKTVRGSLTVFCGAIIVADIRIALRVNSNAESPTHVLPQTDRAQRYRNIFASYAHRDKDIVNQCTEMAKALGDRYLRDCIDLRSGEKWSERLKEMIKQADIFQLFWSKNALGSIHVREEWEFALSLERADFIRPTYWEEPLPQDESQGLPPDALRKLHFQLIAAQPQYTQMPRVIDQDDSNIKVSDRIDSTNIFNSSQPTKPPCCPSLSSESPLSVNEEKSFTESGERARLRHRYKLSIYKLSQIASLVSIVAVTCVFFILNTNVDKIDADNSTMGPNRPPEAPHPPQECIPAKPNPIPSPDSPSQNVLESSGHRSIFRSRIQFAKNSTKILKTSSSTLNELTNLIKIERWEVVRISIQGYKSSDEDAASLAENRADAVKERLLKAGANQGQIRVIRFGLDRANANDETEKERAENRKVEIMIIVRNRQQAIQIEGDHI